MTEQAKPLNIYQRVQKVREAIAYVKKDRDVTTGGSGKYKAVSHDMVTAEVRPQLIQFGVVIVPTLIETATVDTGRKTSSGTPIIRVEAIYDVAFVSIDEPATERIVMRLSAHGEDMGDKGPGKCLSYVVKNGMLKLLSLETGEDDEGRIVGGSAMPTNEEADFYILIDEADAPNTLTEAWARASKAAQAYGDKEAEARLTDRAGKAKARIKAALAKKKEAATA